MKAILWYLLICAVLLLGALAIHEMPVSKQGSALMGGLFFCGVGLIYRIFKG
jgi:hypothetical protein